MAGTAQDKKKEELAAQDAPTNNLTFGESAVGIQDGVSHGKDIDSVNSTFAKLIDQCNDLRAITEEPAEKKGDQPVPVHPRGELKARASMAIEALMNARANMIAALEWEDK